MFICYGTERGEQPEAEQELRGWIYRARLRLLVICVDRALSPPHGVRSLGDDANINMNIVSEVANCEVLCFFKSQSLFNYSGLPAWYLEINYYMHFEKYKVVSGINKTGLFFAHRILENS